MIPGGGGGAVDLDGNVDEVGVDGGVEDFGEEPDLVSHLAELAAEVGCVAFRSPLGEGAFASDDGKFH